jgi:response regulator RpfG family c-di-GMP phosphodiesterase
MLTVMNEKKLRILLLDDEYQEYENWNKWAGLIEWSPNIFYASTVSEAIELSSAHKIDIFVVDIFLGEENGIEFLNAIKNTPGIKLAISNTVNSVEIKQIAELGAVLFSKQNTQSSSLKLLSTIKAMGELGKQPNEPFLLNQPDFSTISTKIDKNEREIHSINIRLNNVIQEHTETITTVEEIKSNIIGSYDKKGIKDRLDILEDSTESHKNSGLTILLKYLVEESKKSPGLLVLVLIVLLFSALSLPFIILKGLID